MLYNQHTFSGHSKEVTWEIMWNNTMANIHDDEPEVNLRLSAEDLSGLGPDAQRLLRQLAASQQEQQQRQPMPSFSHLALPARRLSAQSQETIQRPASIESAAGPPSDSNMAHRTLPSRWHHQVTIPQPSEMGLDDFGKL